MRTEDGYLIDKCLNGEPEAFGLLVDTYKSSLYALAYARVRNLHDAEDITQEAFIKAYKNLRTLKRGDSFKAWLYSITSNLCKNFLRSKSRRPDDEFIDNPGVDVAEPTVVDDALDDPMHEMLHESLAALPAMYREVLTLHYLGGMKSREIAQFLGTSKNTIDTRLRHAKSYLKEEMLTMMSTTFEQYRLQPSFTFRIMEMIKETKIQSAPHKTTLPWGISIAAGLVAIFISFTVPFSPLFPIGTLIGSALPTQTQVAEFGEIPVDTIEITEITVLSTEKGDRDFGQKPRPNPMSAFAPARQEGKWRGRARMRTKRWMLAATVVNGKIYAIGGLGPTRFNAKTLPTVEEYDPVADKWTEKADMPTPGYLLSASSVNGKIYVIGGWAGRAKGPRSTVEEYDPVTDTWTQKADMLTRRSSLSTSVVNGKIYAIGGGQWRKVFSTVEMYDSVTDKWTQKADMPTARAALSTSVVNGKIYAIGGSDSVEDFPTVEMYDPATDIWVKKADMPTPRSDFATGVARGGIHAIGGTAMIRRGEPGIWETISKVEVYQPARDRWTKEVDMRVPRGYIAAGTVNGKIYVIGGTSVRPGLPLAKVEEFDTGFAVNPAGKLATLWGQIKSAR